MALTIVQNPIKSLKSIGFNRKYPIIIFQIILKLLLRTLAILLIISLLIYSQTTIYNFPNTAPFTGKKIFNPYQNTFGNTVKANFHAHSKAWAGLTNGHNSAEELKNSYHKKGYSLAAISNYFAHDTTNNGFQVYEHGINILKAHCLAINAKKVSYFDFPIFQNVSHKQQIINQLKNNGALVALAHPHIRGGHSEADMQELVGYNFTEVLNHYVTSDKEWDAALQTGKLSWIMANDDTHDINNEPSHQIWNEIYSDNESDIIKNISEGKNYGIKTKSGIKDLAIKYLYVKNDSVYFNFGENTRQISIIINGQNKLEIKGNKGQIYFAKEYNYIRFVAESANAELFTNPLIRYDGEKPILANNLTAGINQYLTTSERVKYYSFLYIVLIWVNRKSILKLIVRNRSNNSVLKSPLLRFFNY